MLNLNIPLAEDAQQGTAGTDITKLLFRLLSLPLSTEQPVIQDGLMQLYELGGLPIALNTLYQMELKAGYISNEKLENNDRYLFFDADLEIDFEIQVNRARSGYTPTVTGPEDLDPLHCAICMENAGRPGKENLRVFLLPAESAGLETPEPEKGLGSVFSLSRNFFFQLTPYPVFPYHFVVITEEPVPMQVDRKSMEEMIFFALAAPGYTVCSNSDVEGAGSSILEHHHLQMVKGLTLPAMTAGISRAFQIGGCTAEILRYPLTAVRIYGGDIQVVLDSAVFLVEGWKGLSPGRNTVNLIFSRTGGTSSFQIFFRNPDYTTPKRLLRIKSEGIGIMEAAGVGIFPVPSGPDEGEIWNAIRGSGKEIMKDILTAINPAADDCRQVIEDMLASLNKEGDSG